MQGGWAGGVPEAHLKGHAFHTYTLTSADSSVQFQFKHNVCGRATYADGVVDAVRFLAAQVKAGGAGKEGGRIYTMVVRPTSLVFAGRHVGCSFPQRR